MLVPIRDIIAKAKEDKTPKCKRAFAMPTGARCFIGGIGQYFGDEFIKVSDALERVKVPAALQDVLDIPETNVYGEPYRREGNISLSLLAIRANDKTDLPKAVIADKLLASLSDDVLNRRVRITVAS